MKFENLEVKMKDLELHDTILKGLGPQFQFIAAS